MDSMEPPSAPLPNISPPPNSYPPILSPNSTSSVQNPSYSPYSGGGGGGGGSFSGVGGGEVAKKKRGRPRKYSPENGNNSSIGIISQSTNPNGSGSGAIVPFEGERVAEEGRGSETGKRGRGRPPGSGKKQLDALGGGINFTPHMLLVKAGEDICSKIMAFSQQGPRTICVLSASGAISNASICHSTLSGGTVTYEGRYEIISLSGSFTPSESNAGRSRTGGLSVTLAGPDGQVLGGSLSGILIAASPVQILAGSFIEDGKKPKSAPSSSPNMLNFGAPVAAASPQSQEPSNGSSDENGGSPFEENSGPYTNANQQQPSLHSMPMYSQSGWETGP